MASCCVFDTLLLSGMSAGGVAVYDRGCRPKQCDQADECLIWTFLRLCRSIPSMHVMDKQGKIVAGYYQTWLRL